MPHRLVHPRVLLCCLLAAALAVWGCAARQITARPAVGALKDITPQTRDRIDELARDVVLAAGEQPHRDVLGSFAAWVIAQTPLSTAEEMADAGSVHGEIVRTSRVVPTPKAALDIVSQLSLDLAPPLRPSGLKFTLTVLEDEPESGTVGGGFIYLSRARLESLLADTVRGRDALAFVLAHEMAHTCRQDCRRGYQLLRLEQALSEDGAERIDREWLQAALRISVREAGKRVSFSYARTEVLGADLFAIHLCRNAGFNVQHCLDVLRAEAAASQSIALAHGGVSSRPAESPGEDETGPLPSPLERLQLLALELSGAPPPGAFGLMSYDRPSGEFVPAADQLVPSGAPALVMIHGMDSDLGAYKTLVTDLAQRHEFDSARLLGYQYPNDQSLARSGIWLKKEMDRVCPGAERVDFICHSAGGLVFRYYAESERGKFRRAVFQGTPHAGSDVARLRPLLEFEKFVGNLNLGYSPALDRALGRGLGQIGHDLQPESLFLRWLKRGRPNRERYFVTRGEALSRESVVIVRSAVMAGLAAVKVRECRSASEIRKRWIRNAIDHVEVPSEITEGDLAVTLTSAVAVAPHEVATFPIDHLQLTEDPAVLTQVVAWLNEPDAPPKKTATRGKGVRNVPDTFSSPW